MNVLEPYRQKVRQLQHKIKDLMDHPNDAAARSLNQQVQRLEDDMEMGKHPGTLANNIEHIIRLLEHEAKDQRIMNYEHLDMFRKEFEHLHDAMKRMR